MVFERLGNPIKTKRMNTDQGDRPQHCHRNQENRQSYREPEEAHLLALITTELICDYQVLGGSLITVPQRPNTDRKPKRQSPIRFRD
jgi:hypothetical protein